MKKVLAVILVGLVISNTSFVSKANSLSYLPSEEVDGIPERITQIAEIVGNEFNICPELLEAIAYYESRFTATATNGNCKGLMQVNPTIHAGRFEAEGWSSDDWTNDYINMYVAASYLSELFEEYEDVGIVLGLYHGESNAIAKGQNGNLSSYTKKVLEKSEEYERLHGK